MRMITPARNWCENPKEGKPESAIAAARSIGWDHFIGDVGHAWYPLGERSQGLAFGFGTDQAPEMHDAVLHDNVATAEIRPFLLAQPIEQFQADAVVGRVFRLGRGFGRGYGLYEVGSADDADNLTVADDRHPLDAVAFQ